MKLIRETSQLRQLSLGFVDPTQLRERIRAPAVPPLRYRATVGVAGKMESTLCELKTFFDSVWS